jgi:hypothetical protein
MRFETRRKEPMLTAALAPSCHSHSRSERRACTDQGRAPIFDIDPQNAIRAAIGAAGGDALTNIVDLEAKGSTKLMKCYFLGGLRK